MIKQDILEYFKDINHAYNDCTRYDTLKEDEMVGWHHRHNGHESEQPLDVGDGQGGLACCSPWGHRVGHDRVTELN